MVHELYELSLFTQKKA